MWFPVEKCVYQVQASIAQDPVLGPTDLDLEPGHSEPDLRFSRSQVRDPAYDLLDSGGTHVLLPGHILQSSSWQRKKHDAGEMRFTLRTEHIHFFL